MPFFSDSFREKVRAANDIVDVIGASIPLKRAGANFVCLCPFHKEKSPSFNVNPSKQIFHCFGCHVGGDVFKFVQMYENISFPEAIQRLAERARIPLEFEGTAGAREQRGVKDSLLQLHEALCVRWQQCLANEAAGQVARDYLTQRGVSPAAVREFRLGAAPDAWDDTVNWAKTKGFDLALCEQAGLVIKKEDSGRTYDRFRGRLMFPICDEQGRVVAFSGRVLQGDEKTAKYVNSPETPLFTKGRVLYALDKAKRAILDAGHAVICEGQLDTIACHSAGVRNVVAPQGTALTPEHARVLKRYVDEVVLCFDGDKAGRAASIRSYDGLLASGLAARVATIPAPDDPDSFIRQHGADAFREVLGRAEGYFDFYLRHLMAENDPATDRGRTAIVHDLAEAVQKTGNAVLVDTYAQKAAQRLGVSVDAARAEFRKARRALPSAEASEPPLMEPDAEGASEPPPQLELWLLKYLLLSPALSQFAATHLDPEWLSHPVVRRIVGLHFSGHSELPSLLAQLEGNDYARSLVTAAASEQRALPNPEAALSDALIRLRNVALDRRIAALTTRLADPGLSDQDQNETLRELHQLRLGKRQPLSPIQDD
ncbi:MAG TPA: DNA primase [Verrucomicrobiota bacterium]|nr:DNA primase [Verrucomicrobiales bacterium]HRI16261.1 DNA primase [Verrucomicrobiota bacterium]